MPETAPRRYHVGEALGQLEESFRVHALVDFAPPPQCILELCSFSSNEKQEDWRPYFGIGARFTANGSVGVRLELEAIDREDGDPTTMVSIGAAVGF